MQVVSRGMRNRKVGSHEMNMESSRSHSIVTVFLETPASDDNDNCARYGKVKSCAELAWPGLARSSSLAALQLLPSISQA